MPPTNILLGMSVPYFGTDGENARGVSGKDISISTAQQNKQNHKWCQKMLTASIANSNFSKSKLHIKIFTFLFINYRKTAFQLNAAPN